MKINNVKARFVIVEKFKQDITNIVNHLISVNRKITRSNKINLVSLIVALAI